MRLRAGAASAVALAVAGAGLVAAGIASGYAPAAVRQAVGQVWLASSAVGQVTLVDGSTGDVAARLPVAPAGHGLVVAQSDADALVADRASGEVLRIRGATHDTAPGRVRPLPNAASSLSVFAGHGAAYVVDAEQGTAVGVDPDTMTASGRPVSVAASLDPDGVAVDAAGRLWAVDAATGDLVRLDGGGKRTWRRVATAGAGEVVLAGGRPVVVDRARSGAVAVDPESGRVTAAGCLVMDRDEPVAFGGSSTGDLVFTAAGRRGVLLVTDLAAGTCDRVVLLGEEGLDLGRPVESNGRVFVPDHASGRVFVVDLATDRRVAVPQVLPARRSAFELFSRDGTVFYNDPGSDQAGVILLDGRVRRVQKYDPRDPDADVGLDGEGGGRGTPTVPTVTTTVPSPAAADTAAPLRVRISTRRVVAGTPVGLQVVATGARLTDASWSFGDRSGPAGGLTVSHTWRQPGSYRVTVRATTDDGRALFATVVVPVAGTGSVPGSSTTGTTVTTTTTTTTTARDRAPVARLTVTPRTAETSATVSADGRSSSDDRRIVRATLAWGDGATSRSSGPSGALRFSHRYTEVGTFTVRLTVWDAADQRDSVTSRVTVQPRVVVDTTLSGGEPFDLDLDTGSVGSGTIDLSETMISGIDSEGNVAFARFFNAEDGAALAVVGNASYATCAAASPSDDSARLSEGLILCVRTGGGRLSVVRITGISSATAMGTLTVAVTTWDTA